MNKVFKHKINNQMDDAKGFTIIEVLMAMAVLTIGLLAIGSVQISAINGNSTGKMTSQAASFASDQMERLLALNFTDPQLSNNQRTQGSYTIVWTIAPVATANTRLITVTVTSGNPAMRNKRLILNGIKTASI